MESYKACGCVCVPSDGEFCAKFGTVGEVGVDASKYGLVGRIEQGAQGVGFEVLFS